MLSKAMHALACRSERTWHLVIMNIYEHVSQKARRGNLFLSKGARIASGCKCFWTIVAASA
jgi:hypothetical protein